MLLRNSRAWSRTTRTCLTSPSPAPLQLLPPPSYYLWWAWSGPLGGTSPRYLRLPVISDAYDDGCLSSRLPVSWLLVITAACHHGCLSSWLPVSMAACHHGCLSAWLPVIMAACHYGCLSSQMHVIMAACHHGCLSSSLPVISDACDHGCLSSSLPVISDACDHGCLSSRLPVIITACHQGPLPLRVRTQRSLPDQLRCTAMHPSSLCQSLRWFWSHGLVTMQHEFKLPCWCVRA